MTHGYRGARTTPGGTLRLGLESKATVAPCAGNQRPCPILGGLCVSFSCGGNHLPTSGSCSCRRIDVISASRVDGPRRLTIHYGKKYVEFNLTYRNRHATLPSQLNTNPVLIAPLIHPSHCVTASCRSGSPSELRWSGGPVRSAGSLASREGCRRRTRLIETSFCANSLQHEMLTVHWNPEFLHRAAIRATY